MIAVYKQLPIFKDYSFSKLSVLIIHAFQRAFSLSVPCHTYSRFLLPLLLLFLLLNNCVIYQTCISAGVLSLCHISNTLRLYVVSSSSSFNWMILWYKHFSTRSLSVQCHTHSTSTFLAIQTNVTPNSPFGQGKPAPTLSTRRRGYTQLRQKTVTSFPAPPLLDSFTLVHSSPLIQK